MCFARVGSHAPSVRKSGCQACPRGRSARQPLHQAHDAGRCRPQQPPHRSAVGTHLAAATAPRRRTRRCRAAALRSLARRPARFSACMAVGGRAAAMRAGPAIPGDRRGVAAVPLTCAAAPMPTPCTLLISQTWRSKPTLRSCQHTTCLHSRSPPSPLAAALGRRAPGWATVC